MSNQKLILRCNIYTIRITMPPYGEDFRRFFKASDSIIFNKAADLMVIGPSVMEGLAGATQRKWVRVALPVLDFVFLFIYSFFFLLLGG